MYVSLTTHALKGGGIALHCTDIKGTIGLTLDFNFIVTFCTVNSNQNLGEPLDYVMQSAINLNIFYFLSLICGNLLIPYLMRFRITSNHTVHY